MPPNQQVALIIGASRGIGRQIAIDLAKNGYAVMLSAKTTSDTSTVIPFPPDPNSSQSTINTVEREICEAGGHAATVAVDVRDAAQIQHAVEETVRVFGKLDVLVYNSGAIWWSSVEDTPLKRFKLMQQVNPEGLYATIQAALPFFEKGGGKGALLLFRRLFIRGKVGMSVLVKGLAMDFVRQGRNEMAVTSIWPASSIESAATEHNKGSDKSYKKDLRKPTIFSDAVLAMLRAPHQIVNGLLDTDEDFLREKCGVSDFSKYSVIPGSTPRRIMPVKFPVLEVAEQDDEGQRMDSTKLRAKI
ncbi:hypothetical protein N7447_009252 [Penicillium robsamsonii]|uniref:uncharacterized protein n=1 Tax=Penicillium robsamsonii TaxID=1792511 RepID=UPI002548483D|nr:uncharacterized protein N7447_009252 [Penicillium robsamsonii]KAJ5817019.1 hypothetical protein N7447_009252 [Penicillium robsamsonii]